MKLIFNLDAYAEIPGTMVMLKTNFKEFVRTKMPHEFNKFEDEDFDAVYVIKEVTPDYYFGRIIIISCERSNTQRIFISTNSHWLIFLGGEYIKL